MTNKKSHPVKLVHKENFTEDVRVREVIRTYFSTAQAILSKIAEKEKIEAGFYN